MDTILRHPATLFGILPNCRHTRECKTVSDLDWLPLGTLRVFQESPSGSGFLQQLLPHCSQTPSLSLFFENLKSPRRLALYAEAIRRITFHDPLSAKTYLFSPTK